MKNEVVEMPYEIIKSEKTIQEIISGGSKTINYSDLPAYGLAGNELINFVNIRKQIGGEGLYRVTFPQGVSGTLSRFKNEDAFLGSIMGDGKLAQARLTQVSINPEQVFMALALISIDLKLNQIIELQEQIVNFLYAKEEAQIAGNMKMLNEAIDCYKYNADNSEFVSQKLILVDSIKSDSQKSIALYRKQIETAMASIDNIHLVRSANLKAGEINKLIVSMYGAYYVLIYATFFETYLIGNFDSNNLNNVKNLILNYTKEYSDFYLLCERWIQKTIDSSVNHVLAPALKKIDEIFENSLKHLQIGIDKYYKDDSQLYISADEQLQKIKNYKKLDAKTFSDEIDKINRIHNRSTEVYLDAHCLYITAADEA